MVTKIQPLKFDFTHAEHIYSVDDLNRRIQTIFLEGKIGCIDMSFSDGFLRIAVIPGLNTNLLVNKLESAVAIKFVFDGSKQIAVAKLQESVENYHARVEFLAVSKDNTIQLLALHASLRESSRT